MKDIHIFSFQNIFAALIFGAVYFYFLEHPDPTVNETYKSIVMIIIGFVFGSSKSSTKKDDTIQSMAQTANVETIKTEDISGPVTAQTIEKKTDETTI